MKKIMVGLLAIGALAAGMAVKQSLQSDFTLLEGEAMTWQELEGQWVVVNYFAEWCAPCLKEVPELNAFAQYAESQADVSLFAISYDKLGKDALQQLQTKYSMHFPLIASLEAAPPFPQPKSLPTTFILRPDGTLLKQLLGEQTSESLELIIKTARTLD